MRQDAWRLVNSAGRCGVAAWLMFPRERPIVDAASWNLRHVFRSATDVHCFLPLDDETVDAHCRRDVLLHRHSLAIRMRRSAELIRQGGTNGWSW
jgi:hypothetical protein